MSIDEYNNNPSFLNGLGVAADAIGALTPFVPAGIGSIRQCLKAVNSKLPHAAERAVERDIFPNKDAAEEALRNLTKQIDQNGFPADAIQDTAHVDRVLVPIGDNGLAVYQVAKNGTAKLQTVLIKR